MPDGTDWHDYFRPAALALVRGGNPYDVPGFYNPPWILVPLIPIALLPPALGRLALFLVSLAGFCALLVHLKPTPIAAALFLVAPPVVICLNDGNVDWLPMLSLLLPAPWALVLAATKPQVGGGLGIYLLVEAWRSGGARALVRTGLPVTVLGAVSLALYGLPDDPMAALAGWWNVSLFPYGVPVGLVLLWMALREQRALAALGAGPFFSPYVNQFSWAAPLAVLIHSPKRLAVAVAILWIPVILRVLLL
jgi:hypothetical protein